MKIYGDTKSGNCYKVQLVCHLLNIDHQWIDVDILAGDTQSDEFLKKNPNGKIPLLELEAYPAIRAWLDRVAALPNFRPMV